MATRAEKAPMAKLPSDTYRLIRRKLDDRAFVVIGTTGLMVALALYLHAIHLLIRFHPTRDGPGDEPFWYISTRVELVVALVLFLPVCTFTLSATDGLEIDRRARTVTRWTEVLMLPVWRSVQPLNDPCGLKVERTEVCLRAATVHDVRVVCAGGKEEVHVFTTLNKEVAYQLFEGLPRWLILDPAKHADAAGMVEEG